MGCCLTKTAAAGDDTCQLVDTKTITGEPPPPPPPPPPLGFEEETVKEVLPETSIISRKPPPSNFTPTQITRQNQQILHPVQEFRSKNNVIRLTGNPIEENDSGVSSEMYTYSQSFSAATTTTDLKRSEIDEEEVTQKPKKLPPAKMVPRRQPTTPSVDRARRRERPPPPARRSKVPSTDKKVQIPSRSIQRHRNVVASAIIRREPPVRRGWSPAMRGEAVQVRKVKQRSPPRKAAGNRVPVNEETVKLKKIVESEAYELLENPRVSLECFIFL